MEGLRITAAMVKTIPESMFYHTQTLQPLSISDSLGEMPLTSTNDVIVRILE